MTLAAFTPTSQSFAISEIDYAQVYQSQVLPFYYEQGRFGTIFGKRGVALSYAAFQNPIGIGSVVIAPGYNESHRKYAETAYDLFQKGFSVYILDHRGQGASARGLKDKHKGYVDRFSFFVLDLKTFVNEVVPANKPRFLLAHSMGGAIGALYLERYPDDFHAAVLSSPMLEINLGRPEWLAAVELTALAVVGKKNEYVPGTGYYDPSKLAFENNTVTHSRARFANNTQILVEHPELFLAGQTVHWLLEGLGASFIARNNGDLVKTPTLVFQAGDDKIVNPGGQNTFCASVRQCRVLRFGGSNHEILHEGDVLRSVAMEKISTFFAGHAHLFQRQMKLLAQVSF
jgi:lysophospholipase